MRSGRDGVNISRARRDWRSNAAVVAAAVASMMMLLAVVVFVLWMAGAVYEDGPEWMEGADNGWLAE